ncbi:MAG: PilZ domain-containing protein [Deltaproteobacteria bacterium]|nr:PilZ domain-containing protein [Deltaproteobacteria bacterium]
MSDFDDIKIIVHETGTKIVSAEPSGDTRDSPRFNTTMFARCFNELNMLECRGNISASGFCFETSTEPNVGSLVDLLLRLPAAGFWVRARGKVLGCEKVDDGIRVRGKLMEIDIGDAGFLIEWLDSIRHLRCVA